MRWTHALWLTALFFGGCEDDPNARITDVEGPRGPTVGPGPWAADVLTTGGSGIIFYALDEGPFTAVSGVRVEDGWVRGLIPAAPVGARVRYYAGLGSERSPPGAPGESFAFVVVDPTIQPPPIEPAVDCDLSVQRPASIMTANDDNAPQAGLQTHFIVEGVVPDQTAGVLVTPNSRYAARGLGGLLVFGHVDVPEGGMDYTIEATTPAGRRCQLAGSVRAP